MAKGKVQYAEVLFETGTRSIASFESLDEFKEGLFEQNRRAMAGERGGPHPQAAERVAKVWLYDEHPDDYSNSGLLPVDAVREAVTSIALGDQVSLEELISELRTIQSPVDLEALAAGGRTSVFKAKEASELNLDFLEGAKA